MNVPLNRTFSVFKPSGEASDEDFDYRELGAMLGDVGLSWSHVLQKRVAVILGEAGIGKTFEFQQQAARLQCKGKAAFFLSLNQIHSRESAQAVLDEQKARFETWRRSDDTGYFFLDAVDEARLLSGTPALQTALRAIRDVLRPYLYHVAFFISSRITDWSVPDVQPAIEQTLLKPICDAARSNEAAGSTDTDTLEILPDEHELAIQLAVYRLAPLSEPDAKRLAEAHGAKPVADFWQAVEEGGYEFMATRPLDLEWMAQRWAADKKLGTYAELIEAAIIHRLQESNQTYIEPEPSCRQRS